MTAELLQEMRKMNKLLVLIATKDLSQTEKIALLDKVGIGQKEIAELVGTTSNTVGVALHQIRKTKKKNNGKKKK